MNPIINGVPVASLPVKGGAEIEVHSQHLIAMLVQRSVYEICGLTSDKYRNRLTKNVIESWTTHDPEAAAEFTANQEDPMVRAELGHAVAAGLAEIDPKVALAWAEENLHASARAAAIGDIVKKLAEEDIVYASKLVADMEPGGPLNRAVSALVSEWMNSDPSKNHAMLDWIGTLTDSEARQRAVGSLEWQLTSNGVDGLISFVAGNMVTLLLIRWCLALPSNARGKTQNLPSPGHNHYLTSTLRVLLPR